MAKYEKLINNIVSNIGGKDNIVGVTHCVTRLRFNLKDESKANDDVVKNLDGVVTVMKAGGQYQVVIGNHVPDVYAELTQMLGISGESAEKVKMSFGDKAIDIITGIMMPSISVLAAAGMIKGFTAMFVAFGLMSMEGSWYALFNAIGDTVFFFFPVILGFNAAKKFRLNPYLGIVMGAALCYPTINGVPLEFFGFEVNLTYTSTVLPIIFIVAAAAPFERFLNRVIPDVVKTFLTPMIVLVIMVPIGYLLIGPIANGISGVLSVLLISIYNISPAIAGLLLGTFWQVLVIFGVHSALLIPSIINLTNGTPDPIFPLIIFASFAQTGMVFAIWLKTKDKKLKGIAFPAWISGIFGVTEPAIYGITLPRIKYFAITCGVSGIIAAIVGALNVNMYVMAGLGIFSLPGAINNTTGDFRDFIIIAIGMLAATVIAAVIGLITYKDSAYPQLISKEADAEKESLVKQTQDITSPIEGEIIPLSEVKDGAFSEGLLGSGVGIIPTKGEVYAPFDCTLMTVFPTGHAIGMVSDAGVELLVHIGLNTVQLDGKHFEVHVNQGDVVKAGTKLVTFDIDAIKAEGYDITTPIIITNTKDYLDVVVMNENGVNTKDELLKVMV